jgi:hypothetical protein
VNGAKEQGGLSVVRVKLKTKAEKASSRGRASKTKGASFERDTGVRLSNWLTLGERGDIFSRNVLSGGKFTRSNASGGREGVPGDLAGTHPVAYHFLLHYLVECKHYAALNWEGFVYDTKRTSFLWTVISLCRSQALAAGLEWMIIARQNRRPTSMLVAADVGRRLLAAANPRPPLRYHLMHSGSVMVLEFESVLDCVDATKFIKLTEKRHEV